MYVRNRAEAPFRQRQGLKTQILLQLGDVEATDLCVTWVEVEPRAAQALHQHDPEQVYVIVAGKGRMRIGEEIRDVTAGDLIQVPSGVPHGISNPEDAVLSYISAATPSFSQTAFYDDGHL
jgi:mannose-6-phosphate isomerase-like protein (cupin superfamily)